MKNLSIVVAYDVHTRAIGKDNKLLWKLRSDMNFFKSLTEHHAVIMGRKTYESLPSKFRPLPNRLNIVISKNTDLWEQKENQLLFQSISSILEYIAIREHQQFYIIGGGEIYSQMMNYVDTIYATEVVSNLSGDTFFPSILPNFDEKTILQTVTQDEFNEYNFQIIKYSKKELL